MGLDGQYGQVVGVIMLCNWCLSGWDGHGCQSCVLLRVGRLVTGQYILDDKVVGKARLVGQFIWLIGWMVSVVKLVKWLGCWNQVVRMIYQILDKMEILC